MLYAHTHGNLQLVILHKAKQKKITVMSYYVELPLQCIPLQTENI